MTRLTPHLLALALIGASTAPASAFAADTWLDIRFKETKHSGLDCVSENPGATAYVQGLAYAKSSSAWLNCPLTFHLIDEKYFFEDGTTTLWSPMYWGRVEVSLLDLHPSQEAFCYLVARQRDGTPSYFWMGSTGSSFTGTRHLSLDVPNPASFASAGIACVVPAQYGTQRSGVFAYRLTP